MGKFDLAPLSAWKKDHHSVEEIDYSLLLTHVFGKPIRAEQAFMYLFRRYGLPNTPHDDYKDLCAYTFYTGDESVLVRWRITQGDYHYHLCAFAKYADYHSYRFKPDNEYHKKIQELAEKDGLVFFGGRRPYFFTLWKEGKGGKVRFVGNEIQKAAIQEMWAVMDEPNSDAAWDRIYALMEKNDSEICKKYSSVLSRPGIEWMYDKHFCGAQKYDSQVKASKEQHDWVMSLPEDHFLRRIYFTAMGLFEDWKKPTYIRDQYFNLDCEDCEDCEEGVSYTDFSEQLKKKKKGATDG